MLPKLYCPRCRGVLSDDGRCYKCNPAPGGPLPPSARATVNLIRAAILTIGLICLLVFVTNQLGFSLIDFWVGLVQRTEAWLSQYL